MGSFLLATAEQRFVQNKMAYWVSGKKSRAAYQRKAGKQEFLAWSRLTLLNLPEHQ
jgi:hypothetical protein